MAIRRTALHPALLASVLAAGGMLPAATSQSDESVDEQPVSVLELTTGDGQLTDIAGDGLQNLQQDSTSTQAGFATSAASAAPTASAAFAAPAPVPEPADLAVLTEPISTDAFYVAGVTWQGAEAMPEDATISIRVFENGSWLEWSQLEVENSSDEAGGVGGTEPYIAAGADAVQVQIIGDADQLPPGIRLSLTPAWPSEQEQVLDEPEAAPVQPAEDPLAPQATTELTSQPLRAAQPVVTQAAAMASTGADSPQFAVTSSGSAPRPSIVSRAGWGANESWMKWRPNNVSLRAAVVHHTAGTNNYTQAQAPSIVRGIYHYHAITRGWNDIGYNFLVDKWGRAYEGRSGSLAAPAGRMPVGAHAAPFNTGTVGLSILGDYSNIRGPQAAMNAMADIIAWQFSRANIDPTGHSGMISNGTYARRAGQNLPRVFGHRDVSATTCPGNDIYSRLGWLASAANERIRSQVSSPTPAPTPTPAPVPVPPQIDDVSHTSQVFLTNDWSPWSDVDFRLGNRGVEYFVGDWDGDGKDSLALRVGSKFYTYNANATGARAWIVNYGRPGDEVLVGDWNGDGKDSFAVRRGNTFYVKNRILPGDADEVIQYGRPGDEVLVGDWNGNGRETFAVRRGATFHVKNTIAAGDADHVVTYGRDGDRVLVGDWDGDGTDTFAIRRGFTYHVKNSIAGGNADIVLNYGRTDDAVVVGDWDGNRTDTLGVIRH